MNTTIQSSQPKTNPKLILMCGLPGSGKSTYAKELAKQERATILSTDRIREHVLGNIKDQTKNETVFKILHLAAKELLQGGQSVILDCCNINRKDRKRTLAYFQQFHIQKDIYILATPYLECLTNDEGRKFTVKEEIIKKMLYKFEFPMSFEGFDNVFIKYNKETLEKYKLKDMLLQTVNYNQHSKYHSFTLDQHLLKCQELVKAQGAECHICQAARYHDIGKIDTQEFREEYAHYYQHHNVGAYKLLCSDFLLSPYYTPEVIFLVNTHMLPYGYQAPDLLERCRALCGEQLFQDLMILHQADKAAH